MSVESSSSIDALKTNDIIEQYSELLQEIFKDEIASSEANSITVNQRAFQSWTKQMSKSCAAAVISGALNCVFETNEFMESDALRCLCEIARERLHKKLKEFGMLLSCDCTESFLDWVDIILSKRNCELFPNPITTTMKSNRTSKPVGMEQIGKFGKSNLKEAVSKAVELIENEARSIAQDELETLPCVMGMKKQIAEEEQGEFSRNGNEEDQVKLENFKGDTKSFTLVFPSRDWRQQLKSLLSTARGLSLVSDPAKPSTKMFGNWGIKAGITQVSNGTASCTIILTSASSKPTKAIRERGQFPCPLVVCTDDSEYEQTLQWHYICAHICAPNACLVFHMKNHYALIFAAKSWRSKGNKLHRKLLTAKSGQKPKHWMDWSEVRQHLLRWKGNGILLVEKLVACEQN